MGIPSNDAIRGQKDSVGFASTAAQMAEVWDLSPFGPHPDQLGKAPAGPVWGVISPHDDYLYAGRVYRAVLPLVKAKHILVIGVFHGWRKFDAKDLLVFDSFRAWRSPDGEVPVSALREYLLARLPKEDAVQSAAMHDSEHSVEAVVYWLKHQTPDVDIVPIIVPAMGFDRMHTLAAHLGDALASSLETRGWELGKDVAVVISSDAVHYGPDFKYTPYGEGGVEAYTKACAADRVLLSGPLSGTMTAAKTRQVFKTFCDPKDPGQYRLTWCGRFCIPVGLLLLEKLASDQNATLHGWPLAYATSVGSPQLPAKTPGLGVTAPSNLYHFVGYPAAAYTAGKSE
jgi:AmmeMemoRadiSam system protein B